MNYLDKATTTQGTTLATKTTNGQPYVDMHDQFDITLMGELELTSQTMNSEKVEACAFDSMMIFYFHFKFRNFDLVLTDIITLYKRQKITKTMLCPL